MSITNKLWRGYTYTTRESCKFTKNTWNKTKTANGYKFSAGIGKTIGAGIGIAVGLYAPFEAGARVGEYLIQKYDLNQITVFSEEMFSSCLMAFYFVPITVPVATRVLAEVGNGIGAATGPLLSKCKSTLKGGLEHVVSIDGTQKSSNSQQKYSA